MTWLRRNWAVLFFVWGLVFLAFVLGMAVMELKVFPFKNMLSAADAARDWRQNWRHYLQLRSKYAVRAVYPGTGVTIHDPRAAQPGYTFVTGYRDGEYHAFLLDMQGTVHHEWRVPFSALWSDPQHLEVVPPDFDVLIHGAELLPDGAVMMSYEGLGAVKVDRCSKILWRVPAMTHHSVDALPMGEFLISARRKLTRPRPGLPGIRVGEAGWMWEDTILRIDPQGRIIGEISLLERLFASGLEGLLYANGRDSTRLDYTDDPLHLNNVEALPEEIAAAFPLFAAGDIMVSMRNLNTIAVLDRETFLIKWWMTGSFLRQHDPDFLPNGHILVFDNRKGGREQEFGFSRILEIDPVTRQVVWSYGGSDREPFYTDALGKQQPLANGNILVVEAQRGRVFEVSRSLGGRIVWEWINRIDDELVGVITQAERVATDGVNFLGGTCP